MCMVRNFTLWNWCAMWVCCKSYLGAQKLVKALFELTKPEFQALLTFSSLDCCSSIVFCFCSIVCSNRFSWIHVKSHSNPNKVASKHKWTPIIIKVCYKLVKKKLSEQCYHSIVATVNYTIIFSMHWQYYQTLIHPPVWMTTYNNVDI